jgi:hypothetical protein
MKQFHPPLGMRMILIYGRWIDFDGLSGENLVIAGRICLGESLLNFLKLLIDFVDQRLLLIV